jgi:hypothetical protein
MAVTPTQLSDWYQSQVNSGLANNGILTTGGVTATGDYTINFTNAMPDANYASVGTFGDTTNAAIGTGSIALSTLAKNTGSVRVTQQSPGGTGFAGNRCSVVIFR